MNAEVITVGTELLLGQKLDTNSKHLASRLAEAGINVYYKTTTGDNIGRLKAALCVACARADCVILTGGLGPTVDDITRQAVAEFTGRMLVKDAKSAERIDSYFKARGLPMPEANKMQSYFPEGSVIMENSNGTAPGFITEHEGKIIGAMPGVPAEMIPMADRVLIPHLLRKSKAGKQVISYIVLKLSGIGESAADERMRDLFESSRNPTIGILAHPGEIEIRIAARARNKEEAQEFIKPVREELYRRFFDEIYGEGDDTPASVLGRLLKERNMTLSTAESCTAGMVSSAITSVAGSSEWFRGGVNAYSNESKIKLLGVKEETIERYGAVSAECAVEMARGCRAAFGTDAAVSVTGIAGPGGGTPEKPAGTVYMALIAGEKEKTVKNMFVSDREGVRQRSVIAALSGLIKAVKNGALE